MKNIEDFKRGERFNMENSDPAGPELNGIVHGEGDGGIWASLGWGMGVSVIKTGTKVQKGWSATGFPNPETSNFMSNP